MSLVLLCSSLLGLGSALAAPQPAGLALEGAYEALAAGEPTEAIGKLKAALPTASPKEDSELRCLLGVARLAADQPAEAVEDLASVPLEARCGHQAAFLRARAMLQLGQAKDAVEIYASVGGPRLGPDRDAASADALVAIANQRLSEPAGVEDGLRLLGHALSLEMGPQRRTTVARGLVDAMRTHRPQPWALGMASLACTGVEGVLRRADRAVDRLRAAAVCPQPALAELLAPLGADVQAQLALARRVDGPTALWLREDALTRLAEDAQPAVALELAVAGAADGRLDVAPELLRLASAESLALAAKLLGVAGRRDEAIAAVEQHARTFPTDSEHDALMELRATWMFASARAQLAKGAADEALAAYDEVVRAYPDHEIAPRAALEGGLAARAANDLPAAIERWELVIARWPRDAVADEALGHLAHLILVDQQAPTEAFARLKTWEERSTFAAEWAEALRAPDVQVDAVEHADAPRVRVAARNLEEVELKLHRIDAEAYVRAGGEPMALRELDVAVVAPDRVWSVPVPDYAPFVDRVFDVPIDVPGAGLYAVTVASAQEEARTLLLVSDLEVVARSVGDDLVVATFDAKGRPMGDVDVIAVAGSVVTEGSTDGTGLWQGRHNASSPTVVLARRRGHLGLLWLDRSAASSETRRSIRAELERPIARPGGRLGLRVLAHDGTAPIEGDWTLWLRGNDDTAFTPFSAVSDARGDLAVDIPVPPSPVEVSYSVVAVAPGSPVQLVLASFQSVPEAAATRQLEVEMEGADAVISVREPDGRPVSGAIVTWGSDQRGETDAAGELRVQGPPRGVSWEVHATLAGSRVAGFARRALEEVGALELQVEETRLRPTETPQVRVCGTGPVRVELLKLSDVAEEPPPPLDPWLGRWEEEGPTWVKAWSQLRSESSLPLHPHHHAGG